MKTILVIDDELAIADVLQLALEEEGYRAIVAHNGKAGLACAQASAPDLILLDFMMPIMDGPSTLATMRKDAALSDVPVIIMSSVDERSVAPAIVGYQSFIRKPFRFEVLFGLIRQLLASENTLS